MIQTSYEKSIYGYNVINLYNFEQEQIKNV